MIRITVFPENRIVTAQEGQNLLQILRKESLAPDAPCGGNGTCGKCKVWVDGKEVLACRTTVDQDITVTLPQSRVMQILQAGTVAPGSALAEENGFVLAFDIGTTSVVCFLLDGNSGAELAACSIRNPQTVFGADVISRIQAAMEGEMEAQTSAIRRGMTALIEDACRDAGVEPGQIRVVSVVGNPAMQQLFLGLEPSNLAAVPFAPVLTEAKRIACMEVLPICANAQLLVIPDISGYIGADTVGCVLATRMQEAQQMRLLVDIGTNGEMVMGNRERMIACSTAAGPALEGANIRFGMRAEEGAIDHVWLEQGRICCSVIGNGEAKGICGSGLIDAVAAGLEMGLLNKRGRIQNEARTFYLTEKVYLTQEDIRQVQLAKGAICAGVMLMAKQLGISVQDIEKVQLAGAFGSFLNPKSACRVGLLPEALLDKIETVGNAAGSGAKMLACDAALLPQTEKLVRQIEFLELASLPEFARTFAKAMNFREETR